MANITGSRKSFVPGRVWLWLLPGCFLLLFCLPGLYPAPAQKNNLVWSDNPPAIVEIQNVSFQPTSANQNAWEFASYPIETKAFVEYSSPYGNRPEPCNGCSTFHKGLDIVGQQGDLVLAWWEGEAEVSSEKAGCGTYIVIRSGDWQHMYCHLSEVLINPGHVKTGQAIGKVGETGGVTGPHLHWSLWYKDQSLNPGDVIKAMQRNS